MAATTRPFRQALPWLFFLMGIFLVNFMSRAIFSPLMLSIEQEMHFNHAQAGGIFLMVSLGYSLALIASGYLSSRLTHRNCVILAGYWMGVGMIIVGLCRDQLMLQAALFFLGISSGIYFPSGMASLTSLVEPGSYGKAIAIHELAPNLSLFFAPLLCAALMPFTTWRVILIGLGAAGLVLSALFHAFGRGGRFTGKMPDFSLFRSFAGTPSFWILGALFFLAIGASIGPYSMLPLFLVDERGFDAEWANELLALSRVLSPFAAIASGMAVDRIGAIRTIFFYLLATGACTILMGVTHGHWLTAMVLAQPVFSACYFTAGFACITVIFPKEISSVAISLIVPFGILGGNGLIPTFLGFMGDMGSFGTGFIILGSVLMLGVALLPVLHKAMSGAKAAA